MLALLALVGCDDAADPAAALNDMSTPDARPRLFDAASPDAELADAALDADLPDMDLDASWPDLSFDAALSARDAGPLVDTAFARDALTFDAEPDQGPPDVEPPDAGPSDLGPDAEALPPAWARWDLDRVLIPEGAFVRGSRLPDQPADEKPQRAIAMSAFALHRDEVSLRAWQSCVEAGVCERPGEGEGCTWPRRDEAPRLPVSCVTRAQARIYCQALGGDLPTEAQWEYAARGACDQRGDGVCEQGIDDPDFPWAGVELGCRQARSQLCLDWMEGPEPAWWRSPLGDSIFRVRNAAGNVAEWVLDDYVEDAYAPREGDELDPLMVRPGAPGIIRGGHYATAGTHGLRVADRQPVDPRVPRATVGLRCAFPPGTP